MTQTNNLTTQPINPVVLRKRIFIGAGIALILISIFLLGVKQTEPEWGKLWMIRPLIIVPLAGATGGAFSYFFDHFLGYQGGFKKALAVTLSLIVFIIGLWLGFVLGLDGTLWN
jgi:hypothetical protein